MADPNKKVALGKAFLDRILQHVSEDAREVVRGHIEGNEAALVEIGDGTLRQDDYTRARQAQVEWWNKAKPKLDAVDRAIDAGQFALDANGNIVPAGAVVPAVPAAPPDPRKAPVTREEFITGGAELERNAIFLNARISRIAATHYAEFGEPLANIEDLVAESLEKHVPLQTLYDESVKPRREKTAADKLAADLKAAEERGAARAREELMKQAGQQMPFPVGSSSPSTLDGLKKGADLGDQSHEAAVATLIAETNRLNQSANA